jgi:hypothetical protein
MTLLWKPTSIVVFKTTHTHLFIYSCSNLDGLLRLWDASFAILHTLVALAFVYYSYKFDHITYRSGTDGVFSFYFVR